MDELNKSFDDLLIESGDEFDEGGDVLDEMVVNALESSEESDWNSSDEQSDSSDEGSQWSSTIRRRDQFRFQGFEGVLDRDVLDYQHPIQFYRRFITDEMIELIIRETNRYGLSKYPDWTDIDEEELLKFLAICFQMELEIRSNLKDYWSTRKVFSESFAAKLISRNRFVQILNAFHFADNDAPDKSNRLYKIQPILDMLNEEFAAVYSPGKNVCIDESMIPFRGRVIFRQYIRGKRHKFGIKVYKLCCAGGYTCKFIVYAGQQRDRTCPSSQQAVLDLVAPYLNEGRTVTADNFYTSIALAELLIEQKTNYVGTLRKNRLGIPVDIKNARLKRGEVVARQNNKGVTVLKWNDKREIYMLSTCHDASKGQSNKPVMVEGYNLAKGSVDLSDQMCSYTPFVRKTTKWYLRLFFHLVTQTSVVNAWHVYCVVKERISIKEFKCRIIESILEGWRPTEPTTSRPKLCEVSGPKRTSRRRCVNCYKNGSRIHGAPYARSHAVHLTRNAPFDLCKYLLIL
uniref:DDE_Tnp_1_7 domain-containing protein n=1 Tax=Haemonchus contortus TaxID=6289 RepID=A0A7I4Y4Y7_HAECO